MKKDRFTRFLETIPAFISWFMIIVPLIFAFFLPKYLIYFLIVFTFYWLFRSVLFSINIVRGYIKYSKTKKINWLNKIKKEKSEEFEKIYHAIIFVVYKEPEELVLRSIKTYIDSNYPKEKIIFVLGTEEAAGDYAEKLKNTVKKEFGKEFFAFIATTHPKNIPGELKSKSANATWAARELKKFLDQKNISAENVISHNFDCDTSVEKQYFACVTYRFLSLGKEERIKTAYQPFHVYSNNIWDAPAISRIVAITGTFVALFNTFRQNRLHNFSSRSDCFQSLVNIDYWATDVIPEDSRQYYTSFFYYKGDYKVTPIYLPLHMDAVLADTYKKTILNQYRQLRRWAWGVVDFPFLVKKSIKDKKIPWPKKFYQIYQLTENHLLWSVTPIYLTVLGWTPFLFHPDFRDTVLGQNYPTVIKSILNFASMGWFVMIYLNFLLLPPRPKHRTKFRYIEMIYQWALAPLVSIFFSSVAALDSQTRLALGKYLEYQVTEKAIKMRK